MGHKEFKNIITSCSSSLCNISQESKSHHPRKFTHLHILSLWDTKRTRPVYFPILTRAAATCAICIHLDQA